jgi:hypothetical protein
VRAQTDVPTEDARSSIENAKRAIRETDELRLESRSIGDPAEAVDALAELSDLRTRGADAFFRVDFEFPIDGVTQLRDSGDRRAVALTGSKIVDYARTLKLFPEYEKQLENYRAQTVLFDKLVAEYDATLEVKDAKIEILETTVDAERERSELFKTMADTRKEGFFDSFLRKAGLIVGFAAGVAVGVLAN